MATITLAELKARVLERANMVGSDFIATAELVSIINGEGAELHDTVVAAYADQLTTELEFSIANGSSTYDVAPEMYELRGVDFSVGDGDWLPLGHFQWNERGVYWGGTFRLVGSKIYVTPASMAPGNYRLWYVPEYVNLAADGDALTYPQGWCEAIMAGSAAKCLVKEESDASVQLGLKQQAIKRIEGMAPNRDVSGPETIEFSRNRGYGLLGGFGYEDDDH